MGLKCRTPVPGAEWKGDAHAVNWADWFPGSPSAQHGCLCNLLLSLFPVSPISTPVLFAYITSTTVGLKPETLV